MSGSIHSKARPSFHTIPEIAELLRVSKRTVWRWVATGELAVHRLGRSVRVRDADLRAFLAARREG